MYAVEKGVPLPPQPKTRGVYPFKAMDVGDSFVGPVQAQWAAQQWKKNHPGWDYTAKKQADGTVRIWRLV
jgi:hypothetical protein